jgi:hypothetical protein
MMEDDTPLVHKFEPYKPQPIGSGPHIEKKSPIKRFFSQIWKFIKKFKFVVIIIAVIIAVLIALFIFIPVVAVGPNKYVNEGEVVRLELDQQAKLKYSNVTVKINKFIDNVCPQGQKCFGSGPIVDYDFMIDGQKYVNTSLTPDVPVYRFQIKTIKTDNKTYVDIKIVKS